MLSSLSKRQDSYIRSRKEGLEVYGLLIYPKEPRSNLPPPPFLIQVVVWVLALLLTSTLLEPQRKFKSPASRSPETW